jgi:hypothetical protein
MADYLSIVSLAGKYGECVIDTFVERLTTSSVTVKNAKLRSVENPLNTPATDVTQGFVAFLNRNGNDVGTVEQKLESVAVLLPRKQEPRPPSWFPWRSRPVPLHCAAVTKDKDKNARGEEENANAWLCVEFSLPGGICYIVTYKIPEETIVFPPLAANPQRFTSLNRQIIQAGLFSYTKAAPVDVVNDKDEDEDEDVARAKASQKCEKVPVKKGRSMSDGAKRCAAVAVEPVPVMSRGTKEEENQEQEDIAEVEELLDITAEVCKMAGPDGNFFGRESVDLRIAIADVYEKPTVEVWTRVMTHLVSCADTRAMLMTADGCERQINLAAFSWSPLS